jgi:hypothetical protein
MVGKKFKAAFVAMAPDADPTLHRTVIETSIYQLTSVLVKDEDEGVRVCRDLVKKKGVQSFLLCPGFTNQGVGRIADAVGSKVAVNVSRGDGPSSAVARRYMKEAGFPDR